MTEISLYIGFGNELAFKQFPIINRQFAELLWACSPHRQIQRFCHLQLENAQNRSFAFSYRFLTQDNLSSYNI